MSREYGLGMDRTDLCILWGLPDGGVQRFVMECKILRGSRDATISKGLVQVARYADQYRVDEVYLFILDRKKKKSGMRRYLLNRRNMMECR